jgi:hypothetical protein
MDQALSLKTGEFFSADKASYASSKNMLLVCPECGEPVYFKARETPYVTPFFAHYKELETVKLAKNCSLRIMGSTFQKASCLLPNISQGQLVDKFQKSFCVELYTMFGKHSESLIDFIKESNFLPLDRRDYKEVINAIESYSAFQDINLKQLTRSDLTNLAEGLSDVSTFLRSQYGTWVGNFIYQTAYFLACILHPEALNPNLGKAFFKAGKYQAIFIVEPFRIKSYRSYASEILPEASKRNKAIPKIAAIIVSLLLCKWRNSKAAPKLLMVAEHMQPAAKTKLASTSEDLYSAKQLSNASVVAREPNSKTKSQVAPIKEEINPIRSWHSPSPRQILSPKLSASTVTTSFNQPSKISESLLHRISASRDSTSPFNPENFKYRITVKDAQRIRSLIERARTLYKPSRLGNREELLHWAKTQNSFEAYFMAKLLKIPHYEADFVDNTLNEKLQSWLTWAEQEEARIFSRL